VGLFLESITNSNRRIFSRKVKDDYGPHIGPQTACLRVLL